MKKITVNTAPSYDVYIGGGILKECGSVLMDVLGEAKVCIVTDDTVASLYLDTVRASLSSAGYKNVVSFSIAHGEASKNTENLVELLEFLAKERLTRTDFIVALGGGVVGDLAGFAAAVYLRGIRFVQMPTTLLAAVDSSVGGKTAVDLHHGKNLAGAFHQPSLVICDYKTLDTLPDSFFSDGCAEVIKYGAINDKELFDSLKLGIKNNLEEIIARCVENKAKIVECDEFDKGMRQLLNFGHTVGHAIELKSDFSITHGQAVAMGMVIVTRAAVELGTCTKKELEELISLLESVSLPTDCPFDAKELSEIATADKKRAGDKINIVLPYGIGSCRLYPIQIEDIYNFILKGFAI